MGRAIYRAHSLGARVLTRDDAMGEQTDALVVGAGVVGLAVARALARRGLEVAVIERHRRPGEETSSRNSGVIHSGLYYPPGSLKARLCVAGRDLLYAHCQENHVDYRRCGKIIVAQEAQLERLQALRIGALANGVTDLRRLDAQEVRELEPAIRCGSGLLSPSTGIVDVHGLMSSLQGSLEAHGGVVALNCELLEASVAERGLLATVRSGEDRTTISCRWLINSAGLQACALLSRIHGYPRARLPTAYFAKGSYFACRAAKSWHHLVYPLPNEAGLGVHATLDLDGSVRFGPDVEWVSAPDYALDAARAEGFYAAIREYWPALPDGSLEPAFAGVRPKLVGAGHPAADFVIEAPEDHGVAGLINLLGIESPGITASLAIGEEIVRRIGL